jgi:Uma2 family endonuclease
MHETRTLLTYRDYAAVLDDGRQYEIHDGELSVTPAPGTAHQRISRTLLVALHLHVSARGLGEVFSAPIDLNPVRRVHRSTRHRLRRRRPTQRDQRARYRGPADARARDPLAV